MTAPKFCAVPWKELFITTNGTYGLCCMEDGNFSDHRTAISQSVDTHWNGDYMKMIRNEFIAGRAVDACRHCWQDEATGKVSGRQRRNQTYYGRADLTTADPEVQSTLAQTRADGSTDSKICGLFFSVGDICQLRCTHCSPTYSKSVTKDYQRLNWHVNFKNRREQRPEDIDVDSTDLLWERVREVGSQVRWIKIAGGEPTLSRPLLKFLDWFSEQGYAQHTTLLLNTNAVNIKPAFINVLKNFQQVKVELSVDGVGALDEYVRFPTNWAKKEKIIDNMLEHFPGAVIHSVVYSLNAGGLPDLVRWAATKPAMHSIQCLTYPEELSVHHLPEDCKNIVIQELKQLITGDQEFVMSDNYNPETFRNNGIRSTIKRMQQPGSAEQWNKAKDIVRSYDSIRPVSLAESFPFMKPWLTGDK